MYKKPRKKKKLKERKHVLRTQVRKNQFVPATASRCMTPKRGDTVKIPTIILQTKNQTIPTYTRQEIFYEILAHIFIHTYMYIGKIQCPTKGSGIKNQHQKK